MLSDIVIPSVGESVTSGVIGRWLKKDGEPVQRDEIVLELETDKVTMEVRAPGAGTLKHLAAEGDTVKIGQVVGQVDEAAAHAKAAKPAKEATATSTPTPESTPTTAEPRREPAVAVASSVRTTPLARRLADEKGVDLSKVTPTGPGHRVREKDVADFIERGAGDGPSRNGGAAPGAPAAAPRPGERAVVRERMTPLRQRIAARLVESQQTAAMLTTFNEADMSAVIELRNRHKEEFEKRHGVGLGFMSFFVKAAVQALRTVPMVNAFIVHDEQGRPMIEKHDYADISIAVSTPKGLVVPVIRDAHNLSMAQIELRIRDFAVRARDGKLALDELQGGTFTVTNGGIFGSLMSTPILNPPQSGILGMHAIKNRAVEDPRNPGHVAIRPMMYLALSYDHRIIDGAEAVTFLLTIKRCIEDPARLLMEI